jgi:pyroglutamyl-peptidase
MKRANAPLLLTGFAPFGGERINPSWLVAQALHGQTIAGCRVVSLQLPCEFGAAIHAIHSGITQHRPCVVLALGQAGGRADLTLERVAINVDDARIPDNRGAQPVDEPVCAGAPAAYFSRLPIKAIVAALHEAGVPASVSQTAGTFVCNHVFYGLMHSLRRKRTVRAGFMHVPLLPEQALAGSGQPSMALATMVLGTRLALQTAATLSQDVRHVGGALS